MTVVKIKIRGIRSLYLKRPLIRGLVVSLNIAIRKCVDRAVIALLIEFVKVLSQSQSLNSRNSSKPLASDPNRNKDKQKKNTPKRKPGGQPGHVGTTLKLIDEPDTTRVLTVDRRTAPPGEYRVAGHERRQVFDIEISRVVTEYQAEILEDANGRQFVATFPEGIAYSGDSDHPFWFYPIT